MLLRDATFPQATWATGSISTPTDGGFPPPEAFPFCEAVRGPRLFSQPSESVMISVSLARCVIRYIICYVFAGSDVPILLTVVSAAHTAPAFLSFAECNRMQPNVTECNWIYMDWAWIRSKADSARCLTLSSAG